MRLHSLFFILLSCLAFQINSTEVSMTTYNLGLAHTFVPFAPERITPLVSNLEAHKTDVLCLQEVWKKSDRRTIEKSLKDIYPYHYKTPVKNYRVGGRPTCKISDIFGEGKFVSCMQSKCGEAEGDDFTDCLIDKCGEPLSNLKETNRVCASALMAQVGKSPIASILSIINPFVRAGQFTYKGSNGLMLFSKYPIKEREYIDFKDISTLSRRGALSVVLDIDGRDLRAVCTHLTSDLSRTIPYTGKFENWGSENKEQFSRLLEATNKENYPTALLGDFNCGFKKDSTNVSGELESSCQQAIDLNFSDFLSESLDECTFCNNNLLNDLDQQSEAIDHIFLKGLTAVSGKILFKDEIYILRDRNEQRTNLSDHYGLEVRASF